MGKILAPMLLAIAFFVTTAIVGILYNGNTVTGKKQNMVAAYPAMNLLPFSAPTDDLAVLDEADRPLDMSELPGQIPLRSTELIRTHPNRRQQNTAINTTEDLVGPALVLPAGVQAVAFNEGELEKEIMVEEENPVTGIKTIKIFVLQFKNGNWTLEPKLMATSRTISIDTALLRLDSLRIQVRTTTQ